MGSFGFAEETASRRDSIGIQGIRVRYPSSLRIDTLVLLRAQFGWETLEALLKFPVPRSGFEPGTSGMVDQSVTTRPPHHPFELGQQLERARRDRSKSHPQKIFLKTQKIRQAKCEYRHTSTRTSTPADYADSKNLEGSQRRIVIVQDGRGGPRVEKQARISKVRPYEIVGVSQDGGSQYSKRFGETVLGFGSTACPTCLFTRSLQPDLHL
ncbi:hypothetical protein DPMN_094370 [Dreissena polymorpha]|uniref:Uncharacterized protein n=1 Tax=Dreissena polymorpha TaxID=45954 RepID=A0A9D4L606_DREPO|nr:hypothetical protein DPMN_094370 [Dreissena polymorpha]